MKYDNQMFLRIVARAQNESFIRSTVAAFCVQLNPTIEQIGDVKTAVSEAVTNAVVHAYGAVEGMLEIAVSIRKSVMTVKITDKGKGIADIPKAMQPFFTSSLAEERSGMGFTVMQAMMDSVKVNSVVGKGTTVIMKKDLTTPNA